MNSLSTPAEQTREQTVNPYVGPRTFTEREGRFFFGREREARDLTARIVSERLLLFYAQSGAGKSSLINTRIIPKLRDEERFQVLPVGRVSGAPPASAGALDNIYAYNLMASLDQGDDQPGRLSNVTLSDFLARLSRETMTDADGQRSWRWLYKPELAIEQPPATAADGKARFVLIIDQFEEIITCHPARWHEREDFFRQLNQALLDDPNLWVVLTLREDYVAALDPYAELTFNRLRARVYMQRMDNAAALDAIRKPAELAGRVFAQGVAEQLVDNLRQVRVPGQQSTVAGQYVEPVQLQVVCYQLWQNIQHRPPGLITASDLLDAGDVDRALTQFYEESLAAVLADPTAAEVSERQLRTWFDSELITEAGTRGLVHQDVDRTGGLPNGVVAALQRRFLVRAEARGGDAWIELVHDRLVEPVRASNAAWFPMHLSALQRQAALWEEQGRSDGLLLRGEALVEAERWATVHDSELEPRERDFLVACRKAREQEERERRQSRWIRGLAIAALFLMVVSIGVALLALIQKQEADYQTRVARAEQLSSSALAILESESQQDPSLALMLARDAISVSLSADESPTSNAESALQRVIDQVSPWIATLPQDRHEGAIHGVDFSPDGHTIATSGADETIRLWDIATGNQVQILQGHQNAVWSIRFSPDGRYLVSAGLDGTARVWDLRTGQERAVLPHDDIVWWASFSPDGRFVVTASDDGSARIWNSTSGKLLRELRGHESRVMTANFSPDGEQIVTASGDGTTKLWNAADGGLIRTFSGHGAGVFSAEFDRTGERIITASADGTARIWATDTGEELSPRFSSEYDWMRYAAFDPAGNIVVTAGEEGELKVWDALTGAKVRSLIGHNGLVNAFAIDHSGEYIASVGDDQSLRLWEIRSGKPVYFQEKHLGSVLQIEYSPDGAMIASGGEDGNIILWNADDRKMLHRLAGHINLLTSLSFSPDGRTILSSSRDHTARLWSTATGEILHILKGHDNVVSSARFSSDGRHVVTASWDHTARVWDTMTGELLAELLGHDDYVSFADFDPTGKLVVTTSRDGTGRIWDWQADRIVRILSGGHDNAIRKGVFSPNGEMVATAGEDGRFCLWSQNPSELPICQEGHQGPLTDILFSPDGHRIATGSTDNTARVWNVEGKPIAQYILDHGNTVQRVSFLNDATLVTASHDKTVRFFDMSTGKPLLVLRGHDGPVVDFSYSPDGEMIASASTDGTIRLWQTRSVGQAREFRGHDGPILSVAYHPEAAMAVSGGSDNTAKIWDTEKGTVLRTFDRHLAPVTVVTFSPDGQLVLSADEAGAVLMWRADTGEIVHKLDGHEGAVYSAVFSPHGETLVTTGDNGDVILWDPATGREIERLPGYKGKVLASAFSPDGHTLATAGDDSTVRLWDIESRTPRTQLEGFPGPVNSVVFSPNGKLLATASHDEFLACSELDESESKPTLPSANLVQLWDIETGKQLPFSAGHTRQITGLAFSADGNHLISSSCDGTMLVRNVSNGTLESSVQNTELSPIRAFAISPVELTILTGGDDKVLRTWQSLDNLLEQADSLIQRQPKRYRAEERLRYNFPS